MSGGPPSDPLPAGAFYDRLARAYDQRYAYDPRQTARQAAWLARLRPPGRLLDLGCGTGRMLGPLARAGFRVLGLDISPAMLAQARRVRPAPPLVQAHFGRPLPFADQSFDTIISLHASVIHLTGPGELANLARETRRLLRPGGALVVELPHPAYHPPAAREGIWTTLLPGVSTRRVGPRLREMRLDDWGGLTTRVAHLDFAAIKEWLREFARLEAYPGFGGGRLRLDRGSVVVLVARV